VIYATKPPDLRNLAAAETLSPRSILKTCPGGPSRRLATRCASRRVRIPAPGHDPCRPERSRWYRDRLRGAESWEHGELLYGQLGTVNSSARFFKEDIQDMAGASRNLMRLRPVTYRYNQPYADGSKPVDYGLIAEEVAEVHPDLVVKSRDGQGGTVHYQKLTPMLLNEVQRQHAEIVAQKDEMGAQSDRIRELDQRNQCLQRRLAALEAVLASISAGRRVPLGN